MSVRTIRGNLLFWKISAVFTSLLIILGLVFVKIASHVSTKFYFEASQQLIEDMAGQLSRSSMLLKKGSDTLVTEGGSHPVTSLHPLAKIYLLDTSGGIVDVAVPGDAPKVKKINIQSIKQLIATAKKRYSPDDNLKQDSEESLFSVAPIYRNGVVTGYVYISLANGKEKKIIEAPKRHLFFDLRVNIFFCTLVIAFLIGIITFYLITNTVCQIAMVVTRFKEGDYSARIDSLVKGNLGLLSTTFNEMADVIVANIEKVTSTDKLRQELIANVSHDLRTPLTNMQGFVETLMLKQNSSSKLEKERYLEIIMESSRKLSKLVDQLFQYSKLEANQVMPEKEQFLISELVSDILVKYQLIAKEKKIVLLFQHPGNLPAVFADLALTESVLQNLIDNAIKFTPSNGQITIRLIGTPASVKISVADTGIGIAPEEQAYIFERYKQAPGAGVIQKGMGIGLAIVKKVLDLHQINIYVKSAPGNGTTFWFEMPVFKPS